MPEENLASGQTLEDLSVGNWFEEDEFIIERNGRRMTTVIETPDEEELRKFCYDLVVEEGVVQSIRYNGGQDYSPRDEEYSELMSALEDAKKARTLSKVE